MDKVHNLKLYQHDLAESRDKQRSYLYTVGGCTGSLVVAGTYSISMSMQSSISNRYFHETILITKISLPVAHRNLVIRPRLLKQINEGLAQHKLVLIKAPAGFGKTTLLQQWLGTVPYPVAWLSLDEADNAPLTFLTYCIASLYRAQPALYSESMLQLLTASNTVSIEHIFTTLLNQLAAFPDQILLVLDDYHVIQEPIIHDALRRFINYLPPQFTLVLATRTEPPFSLTRLRGRGEVVELGSRDLRFISDEILAYLSQVTQLTLSKPHIALLETRTRGWIAALQMTALSLQNKTAASIDLLMQRLMGDGTIIADYLAEEVFRHQPLKVQTFLLKTSILDRLCAPLCSEVLNYAITPSDCQTQLEALVRANLFTTVLDEQGLWYSYHPLFSEFLHQRLLEVCPEDAPGLHARASSWYKEQGFSARAVDHALLGGNFNRAARLIGKTGQMILWQGLVSANACMTFDLIEQTTRNMLMRGEVSNLIRWLGALPETIADARPRLQLYYAWVNLLMGDHEAVDQHLTNVEQVCTKYRRRGLLGEAAGIRAAIAMLRGEWLQAADLCQQALDYMPAHRKLLRSATAVNLGSVHIINGELTKARDILAKELDCPQEEYLSVSLAAHLKLAEVRVRQGQIHQAARLYYQALQLNSREQAQFSRILGVTHLGLARVLYEWNSLDQAQVHVDQAIRFGETWKDANTLLKGYIMLACINDAQQDSSKTLKALCQASEISNKMLSLDRIPTRIAACWARLQSKYDWRYEKMIAGQWDMSRSGQTLLARHLLRCGRVEESLNLLEPLLRSAEAAGRFEAAIQILVLQAMAFQARKSPTRAMKRLNRALTLAEPGKYIRVFVEEDNGLVELLKKSLALSLQPSTKRDGPTMSYIGRIFVTLDKLEPPLTSLVDPSITESLSPREQEVLELLVAGKSNTDIAQSLVISVGTVKLHLNRVYKKLEVSSRTEAIVKAINPGILETT